MASRSSLVARSLQTVDLPTFDSLSDHGAMARFMAYLFGAGATLGLVSMLFPQPPGTDHVGVYCVIGLAYATAALAFRLGPRFPRVVLPASLAMGTVLITLGTYFTGQTTSVYAMFYIWTGLTAFYFLGFRQALAQVALVAVAYAVLLAVQGAPSGGERWLITTGTVLVTGVLVGSMKTRVERLLDELRNSVSELARVARTDPLTGLINRRGFSELIERELERTRRTGESFSLLVCDLDHFKRINDNFGHAAGDDALVGAAESICQAVRAMDAVARTGGEEFAVVLPETDAEAAYLIAERVRTGVQEGFALQGLALTVSTGIASAPSAGQDSDSLLSAADEALYRAKGLGRNRSVIHRPAVTRNPVADSATAKS